LAHETHLRRAGHCGLRVCETEHDAADGAFERELVQGGLAGHEVRDDGLAGVECFESVGGAVDVEADLAAFGVSGEAGAVRETSAADGGPNRDVGVSVMLLKNEEEG